MTADLFTDVQDISLPGAEIRYQPGFLAADAARSLFENLHAGLHWQQESIRIGGRDIPTPRLVAWVADPGVRYHYSGTDTPPQDWPEALRPVRRAVEATCDCRFNGALLNLYRDGRDSVSWHSDDERELGPDPIVASLSLGATRRFRMQHKTRRELSYAIDLENGSLLVMAGQTQRHWRHAVPKTRAAVGPRINLTFRRVLSR